MNWLKGVLVGLTGGLAIWLVVPVASGEGTTEETPTVVWAIG